MRAILVGGPVHGKIVEVPDSMEQIAWRVPVENKFVGMSDQIREVKRVETIYTRAPRFDWVYKPDDAVPFAVPEVAIRGMARIVTAEALAFSEQDEVEIAKAHIQQQAVHDATSYPPISRGVWRKTTVYTESVQARGQVFYTVKLDLVWLVEQETLEITV